ncbi:MAG: DUF4129 domain-containing protein [Pirellulales bacterium]|nr:DUF4129 domain-containing protein [Pirellulales bacterium]
MIDPQHRTRTISLGIRCRTCWAALALIAGVASPVLAQAEASGEAVSPPTAEADSAIEQGRESLRQSWFTPPWYDSERDAVKRIDLKPEWDLWKGWDWSGWNLPGMPNLSFLEWVAWILVTLILGALVYILARAWLQRDRRLATSHGTSDEDDADAEEARVEALPFQVARPASDFLTEAERCRRAGNYRDAIIYLFSHELVSLDRQQCIRLSKGKTNRQYLRELSRRVALRSLVEETMVTFEDVFFGDHPLDASAFERCWSRLPEFDQLISQEAA